MQYSSTLRFPFQPITSPIKLFESSSFVDRLKALKHVHRKWSLLLTLSFLFTATWITLFSIFMGIIFLASDGATQNVGDSMFESGSFSANIGLASLSIGSVAFFASWISLSLYYAREKAKLKKRNIFKTFSFYFILVTLPFYSLKKSIQGILFRKQSFSALTLKLLTIIFHLFLLPVWFSAFMLFGYFIHTMIMSDLGLTSHTQPIVGTGSMHPTFPKGTGKDDKENFKQVVTNAEFVKYPNGITLLGNRYLNHDVERLDIIIFENDKTREITKKEYGVASGFTKRVIGMPGDKIELRNGIVYMNGKPLEEPYIAKPQSTFGGQFLSECTTAIIPQNKVFVMGDNRKGSSDSRDIGFVDIKDIQFVLAIQDQKGVWDKHWRDTSKDFDASSKIAFNRETYLKLINEKRKELSLQPLRYHEGLEQSARRRGEVMLKFDDYSVEASKSGYTFQQAISDINYQGGMIGEAPAPGYYDEQELFDFQMLYPSLSSLLFDSQFSEVGVAEVQNINGCPTQVMVHHLGG